MQDQARNELEKHWIQFHEQKISEMEQKWQRLCAEKDASVSRLESENENLVRELQESRRVHQKMKVSLEGELEDAQRQLSTERTQSKSVSKNLRERLDKLQEENALLESSASSLGTRVHLSEDRIRQVRLEVGLPPHASSFSVCASVVVAGGGS